MFGKLAFVAALLAAPAAWAQEDAPPTPAQIAAAKAHADAVISKADAGAFFVNITTTDAALVRHIPSGMTCEFVSMDDRDVIRLYDSVPGAIPRGDDVSCGTWVGRTYVTVFATRYPERAAREDILDSSVGSLMRNWPDARPYRGELQYFLLDGQTEPLMAAFDVELEGQQVRSMILVQHVGDWSFKARATGPASDNSVNEFSGMVFALSLPGGQEAAAAASAGD